jgi:DNA-binding SARP family transcriptional activator
MILREFGVLTLETDDGTVVQRGGKPLVLLLWLAHAGTRASTRDRLGELFWPDDPPANARKSLRQALSSLRRWLGATAIVTEGDLVRLQPASVTLEAHACREAMQSGDWNAIRRSHRAPWAVGAETVGGQAIERWILDGRDALLTEFTAAATRVAAGALRAGAFGDAIAAARDAHAVAPRHEPLAILHAETLNAGGEFARAREVLARHLSERPDHDDDPPSDAFQRLQRQLADSGARRLASAAPGNRPGERLVAREQVLASLLHALALARRGQPHRVLLAGGGGLGKTRLLDELGARLRSYSVQVARVRFSPDLRSRPAAAMSECVRALCALRGASGVGEASAATLVHLAPDLRALFPAVPQLEHAPPPHRVADAVRDLLQAVGEERATVLLLDDVHFLDPWTRDVWRRVHPVPPAAILEVATGLDPESGSADATIILPPLGLVHIRQLLLDAAVLPDAPWAGALVEQLAEASGGAPGTLLRLLRALELDGVLSVRDGEWHVTDIASLTAAIERTAPTARHPGTRDAGRLLAALHLWGRPLAEDDLLGTMARRWRDVPAPEWQEALRALEADGFAALRDGRWAGNGEAFPLRAGDRLDVARLLEALGGQLLSGDEPPSLETVEHLVRLAGAHGVFPAAAHAVRRLSRAAILADLGLKPRALTRHLATVAGRPEWAAPMLRAMGFLGRRTRRALLGVGAVAALGVTLLFAALLRWQPRLVVEAIPMAASVGGNAGLVVQPRVAVYDGFGRYRPEVAATIRVRSDRLQLVGDTLRTTRDGRVQFERLAVVPPGPAEEARPLEGSLRPLVLRFVGPWWMRDATAQVSGAPFVDEGADRLRVMQAAVNGQPVSGSHPVRLPAVAGSLEVTLTFEYSTTLATANYVVGAGPTWLPRETSVVRVAGLPRPIMDAWQTVRFAVPAPTAPGRYAIIIAMGLEDTVDHLFSGTNWAHGLPEWHDGNDLYDLSPADRAFLRDSGWVRRPDLKLAIYRNAKGDPLVDAPPVAGEAGNDVPKIHGTVLEFEITPSAADPASRAVARVP